MVVEAVIPPAFIHVSVIGVGTVIGGVLVEPSVSPLINCVPAPVLIEQRDAFELPQIRMADEPAWTGFGSILSDTVGAGGVTTRTEHVTVGEIRAPSTHCSLKFSVVVPVRDEKSVVRPTGVPAAKPVELADPVRHDHETTIGDDVP